MIFYDTMAPKGAEFMSMVIAVCGTNFCTMAADSRRVDMSDLSVLDEGTRKIFKLNPHVLLGVTGSFSQDEQLLDTVAGVADIEHASGKIVKNAIVAYLKKRALTIQRNYIVGCKLKDGTFMLYEIVVSPEAGKVAVTERSPTKTQNFAMSLAAPPQIDGADILSSAQRGILTCKTHTDLEICLRALVRKAATMDNTVNDSVMIESIF